MKVYKVVGLWPVLLLLSKQRRKLRRSLQTDFSRGIIHGLELASLVVKKEMKRLGGSAK